jgi:hypothetical protein
LGAFNAKTSGAGNSRSRQAECSKDVSAGLSQELVTSMRKPLQLRAPISFVRWICFTGSLKDAG